MTYSIPKILTIFLIIAAIALAHVFRLGQYFQGHTYNLYYSYFSDFILPFAAYYLLTLNEMSFPFLRRWTLKASLVFALATGAEICQLLGIEVLGATFDPFDILMYGLGAAAAAFVEVKIFRKYLGFWD